MENQEKNINVEFEELRQQYASLKQEVEKQNTLNERLIMRSVKKDLRTISGKRYMSLVVALIGIPLVIIVTTDIGLRLPFIIISVIWMLAMCTGNFIRFKDADTGSLASGNTQSFVADMKKRKSGQFRWIRINFSLLILWIGYFIGECIHLGLPKDELIPIIAGIGIGLAIGLTIGFRIHNRIIGAYEGIILELEDPETTHLQI